MNQKIKFLVSSVLLVFICVASLMPASASTIYDNADDFLYNLDTGKQAAYVWTDLTYNSSTNKIKADCWITYKNSYPHILHNCARIVIYRSSGNEINDDEYSNGGRNVVIEKTAPAGFTWCHNNHGINGCINTSNTHSYTSASNCSAVTIATYIRVS